MSATGGASGNPVTFSSLTTGVCTVSGNTVTLVAAGTCTIAANQAGNASYNAAPQVTQSFTVNKVAQSIAFGALADEDLGRCAVHGERHGRGFRQPGHLQFHHHRRVHGFGEHGHARRSGHLHDRCRPGGQRQLQRRDAGDAILHGASADNSRLTLSKAGSGTGGVTSSPAGIDCGATCTANFNSGSSVTLTATAAADSIFAGWSGACTGTTTCTVTMDAAKSVTATFNLATSIPRLYGISTRAQVLTGGDVMIGGFIIGGSTPKTVVVRARGPSLGVAGALADPTLTLVPGSGPVLTNDDWQSDPNAAALLASGFQPGNAKESAILVTLNPGAYTAIVSGVGNTTGVAIVEVYEMDHPEIPLIGISTRGAGADRRQRDDRRLHHPGQFPADGGGARARSLARLAGGDRRARRTRCCNWSRPRTAA